MCLYSPLHLIVTACLCPVFLFTDRTKQNKKRGFFLRVHSPGEAQLRMNGHINEQRAENEQVCPVINGVLNQCRFDLPGDGEASGASVRLHEGQQQPDDTRKPLKHKNSACGGFMRRLGLVLTT